MIPAMRIPIEYGRKTVELSVPRSRLVGVVEPKAVKPMADVEAAVRRSLRRPIGSPPLAEVLEGARTALFLVPDHTRPSPRPTLLPMLEACERLGVQPTLCVAIGRHRAMTDAEIRRHLGADVLRRAPVVQHDPFDRRLHRGLGRTSRGTDIRVNRIVFEHDRVIGTGIIEPSYLAGFSGGRKMMMPGVAFHESIDQNHFLLTDPATRIGRLAGNPLSEDAAEFARACPFHFIAYVVSGPNDEVVSVVSGDPFAAHEAACRRSARIYRVRAKTAPIVVASAGGWPYDCDLVQAKKAIVPATALVERNGAIVLMGDCVEGLGAEGTFIEWLKARTPAEVVRDVRRRELFCLGAHGANILARPIVERNATVILVTRPAIARLLDNTYVRAFTRLGDALHLADLLCGKKAGILVARKARRLIAQTGS